MNEVERLVLQPHPLTRFYPLFLWIVGVVCFTSSLLYPLSPIPFAMIGILYGRKRLAIYSVLSVAFMLVITKGSQGVLILSYSLGLAWIWSEFSRFKIPLINYLIISVGGCFTLLSLTLFVVSNGDIPTYIHNILLTEIKAFIEAPVNQYPQFLYQGDIREYITKQPDEIAAQVTEVLPGILGSIVVLLSFIIVSLAKVKKALIALELPSSLTLWSTPQYFVWMVVGSIPLSIWGTGVLKVFGLTLLFFICACYFLHGLSVVRYWFNMRNVSKWIKAVSYFLIFIFYPFTMAIVGVGLFDPLLQFRERMERVNDEEEGELI